MKIELMPEPHDKTMHLRITVPTGDCYNFILHPSVSSNMYFNEFDRNVIVNLRDMLDEYLNRDS